MSVLHDTVASYDATAKLKVDSTNNSKPRRRSFLSVICALFRSLAGDVCLWESEILAKVSRRQLWDFNIALTLISFILSERWLESRAKQSTGEDIASLLALQAPTALLFEEDGVLVEREADAKLLVECNAPYLVMSTTSKLGCGLFGVEHDDLDEPMVQAPISVGILLLLSEQQLVGNVILEVDRHEVIVLSSELRCG